MIPNIFIFVSLVIQAAETLFFLEHDLSVDDGRLIASPVKQETWTLRDLLSRVRKGNLHGEVDFGESVGREVW